MTVGSSAQFSLPSAHVFERGKAGIPHSGSFSSVMVISAVCSTCPSEEWRGAQDSQVRQCLLLLPFVVVVCLCTIAGRW